MTNDGITVLKTMTVTYSCGSTGVVELHRERGSYYVRSGCVSERYNTKRAALAAMEAWI